MAIIFSYSRQTTGCVLKSRRFRCAAKSVQTGVTRPKRSDCSKGRSDLITTECARAKQVQRLLSVVDESLWVPEMDTRCASFAVIRRNCRNLRNCSHLGAGCTVYHPETLAVFEAPPPERARRPSCRFKFELEPSAHASSADKPSFEFRCGVEQAARASVIFRRFTAPSIHQRGAVTAAPSDAPLADESQPAFPAVAASRRG